MTKSEGDHEIVSAEKKVKITLLQRGSLNESDHISSSDSTGYLR